MFTKDTLDIDLPRIENAMVIPLNQIAKYPHIASDSNLFNALYASYSKSVDHIADPSENISFEDFLIEAEHLLASGFDKRAVVRIIPFYFRLGPDEFMESYLGNRIMCDPSFSLDAWGKRQEKYALTSFQFGEKEYQDILNEHYSMAIERIRMNRKDKKEKTPYPKLKRRYKARIESIYHYFKQQYGFPSCTLDACCAAMEEPSYFNHMSTSITNLFGLVDGGSPNLFALDTSKFYIQKDIWLQAIELMLALAGLDQINISNIGDPAKDEELAGLMNEKYSTVICLGILIHTIRIFDGMDVRRLLYEKYTERDKAEKTPDVTAIETQIQELTQKLNKANKEIECLKRSNQALQIQASSVTKTNVTELIHEHNMILKKKDLQLSEQEDVIKQLEHGLARVTKRFHQAVAETYSRSIKPWQEQKLPETGVLFIGGNQNLLKKLQQKYPNWSYVGTKNAPLPTNVKVIFVMTNHSLSHSVWYRLNRFYTNRELMRYVQATNLNKLEDEMRYEYWEMLRYRKE